MKVLKKIISAISLTLIIVTMGTTVLVSAATNTTNTTENKKLNIWNILTDEQKAQVTSDIKDKLLQDLSNGKITQENYDNAIIAINNGELPSHRGKKQMTDEQKATINAQKSKWDSLSDIQKQEIYNLYENKLEIENQIIDKYLEFGIIDSNTNTNIKARNNHKKTDTINNNKMPILSRGNKIIEKSLSN